MSEHDFLPAGNSDPAALASGVSSSKTPSGLELTAGALLRDARQAQGIHIAALAASLKVPVQKLEALEQDRFDLLLDAVFVRALASSMCRILKLDPEPILQRLPPLNATKVTSQNRGINAPFRSHNGGWSSSLRTQLSKPVIWVGLAFLLGALVLIFLPVVQQGATGRLAGVDISSKTSPLHPFSATVMPVMQPKDASLVVQLNTTGEQSPQSAASEAVPSSAAASMPAAGQPLTSASATVSADNTTNAADTSGNAVATFSAKSESWVKVTDAKGVVVLSRTLQAGESASAIGLLPLNAVIGRANAMQVHVRGQALDLNPLTKNNVARFEVK